MPQTTQVTGYGLISTGAREVELALEKHLKKRIVPGWVFWRTRVDEIKDFVLTFPRGPRRGRIVNEEFQAVYREFERLAAAVEDGEYSGVAALQDGTGTEHHETVHAAATEGDPLLSHSTRAVEDLTRLPSASPAPPEPTPCQPNERDAAWLALRRAMDRLKAACSTTPPSLDRQEWFRAIGRVVVRHQHEWSGPQLERLATRTANAVPLVAEGRLPPIDRVFQASTPFFTTMPAGPAQLTGYGLFSTGARAVEVALEKHLRQRIVPGWLAWRTRVDSIKEFVSTFPKTRSRSRIDNNEFQAIYGEFVRHAAVVEQGSYSSVAALPSPLHPTHFSRLRGLVALRCREGGVAERTFTWNDSNGFEHRETVYATAAETSPLLSHSHHAVVDLSHASSSAPAAAADEEPLNLVAVFSGNVLDVFHAFPQHVRTRDRAVFLCWRDRVNRVLEFVEPYVLARPDPGQITAPMRSDIEQVAEEPSPLDGASFPMFYVSITNTCKRQGLPSINFTWLVSPGVGRTETRNIAAIPRHASPPNQAVATEHKQLCDEK
ncbi:hypothetical protein JCM6882_009460 [Rhodosporidiobolus microsporus]